MKIKLHGGSEPVKKLKHLQTEFNKFYPISAYNSPCILAGGAIRDIYMDKAEYINDYDIFIQDISGMFSQQSLYEDAIEYIIDHVFPRCDAYEILFDSEYLTIKEQHLQKYDIKPGAHTQIASVWEINEDDKTYQLVFTKDDPIQHIEKNFDIGLCKAYCDGNKIRYTPDFLRDVKNKTMTIVGENMSEEQVQYAVTMHAERLMWKYLNFRVVVPSHYQQYVQNLGLPTF